MPPSNSGQFGRQAENAAGPTWSSGGFHMPLPRDITAMGSSAHRVLMAPLAVVNPKPSGGRATLNKNFHVYLELTMQSKHDGLMRGYCKKVGVVDRKEDGTQVTHTSGATAEAALTGIYADKGRIAAEAVAAQMTEKWRTTTPAPGKGVFTPGVRVDAGLQKKPQRDGWGYEVSYWYDVQDIYVLFHCYPPR
jgi:hypothetical protein